MNKVLPGPELDAQVAKEIMGWDIHPITKTLAPMTGRLSENWRLPDPETSEYEIPEFSTDTVLALEVLEVVRGWKKYRIYIEPADGYWNIKAYGGYKMGCTTSGETLAHVICLAAVKAARTRHHLTT